MIEPTKMTATIKVREVIRSLKNKEFSSADIFMRINATKRTQIFSALRNMTKWGEIEIIRRELNGRGTGASTNVYRTVRLAAEGHKTKRKPSKPYEKRPKIVEPAIDHTLNGWLYSGITTILTDACQDA